MQKKTFQLTRSRGAWRNSFNRICSVYIISTHTLTWSVTFPLAISWALLNISTHTLTWSVTFAETQTKYPDTISTHTLTWSVTELLLSVQICYSFQLTRSRGAWQNLSEQKKNQIHFNSHAHVERDHIKIWIGYINVDFNSHAHVERDQNLTKCLLP